MINKEYLQIFRSLVKITCIFTKDLKNSMSGIIFSGIIFTADQVTKMTILQYYNQNSISYIKINDFFDLLLTWNDGISFGMLQKLHNSQIILSVISAFVIFFLFIWLLKSSDLLSRICLGSIIGGALGNIYDRLQYGAVVDFLHFHINNYSWPVFNIADSAICIGAFLLSLKMFNDNKKLQSH